MMAAEQKQRDVSRIHKLREHVTKGGYGAEHEGSDQESKSSL